MLKSSESREFYMCRTSPCIPECGVVAVKVELIRVVEPGIPYRERGKNSDSQ